VELTGAARGIDGDEGVEQRGQLAGCVDGMRRWSGRCGARGRVAFERTGAARGNVKKRVRRGRRRGKTRGPREARRARRGARDAPRRDNTSKILFADPTLLAAPHACAASRATCICAAK
jgi:hypothetical protein